MTDTTSHDYARGSLRYYWMTGCSSCQRTREFLVRHNIEFESINLAEVPERMAEVTARGYRGVPVLMDDQRDILAQDLGNVARFVGVELNHRVLPPPVLVSKMDTVLQSAIASAWTISSTELKQTLPGRERPHRDLIHHIFRVAEAFTEQADETSSQKGELAIFPDEDISTEALIAYGEAVRQKVKTWWETCEDKVGKRKIDTYGGIKTPMNTVLERATWHAAHHTRQLEQLILKSLGHSPPNPLSTETLRGLPLPETVY